MDNYPKLEETLYRLNGTLLKEGDMGKQLKEISERLEKMNWNLGTIAQALKKISERP